MSQSDVPLVPQPSEAPLAREEVMQSSPLLGKEEWHQAVESAVIEAHATEKPLSVLLVDINYFKEVNDTLGHGTGDVVIDDIDGLVRALRDSFRTENEEGEPRPLDLVSVTEFTEPEPVNELDLDNRLIDSEGGRIGGDEFAILAHTDEAGAQAMIKRLRKFFEEYTKRPGNEKLGQIGIGLAIGSATLTSDMTTPTLLHEADMAMYQDKLDQLPELTEHQKRAVAAAKFILEESGIRLRDVPKYFRLGA